MAPNLANPGQMATALPLNELQAAAHQAAPVALVPTNDPMVLNNNNVDLNKVNLYRIGVDQPVALNQDQASGTNILSESRKYRRSSHCSGCTHHRATDAS